MSRPTVNCLIGNTVAKIEEVKYIIMLSVSLQKRQGQTHTLIHSTHIFTRDSSLNSSCGQFNYVCPLKARKAGLTSVFVGV